MIDEDWEDMCVEKGIFRALKPEIKPFTKWLANQRHRADDSTSSTSASCGAVSDEAEAT
jgi:hypothetical protein